MPADEERSLRRSLGTWDLALMGIAVAVGAGIFSVGAQAAANFAGPSVTISFILAAITCGLAIMCYAEFASTVPVAGSAYTFTYATMGELLAWIIGWDLILEMFTGAAVIAKYWGVYLGEALLAIGIPFPATVEIAGVQVSWPAFLIVAVFTVLLVAGTKLTARVGSVFTIIKVAIVLFVIVVGFFFINAANYVPFIPESVPTEGGSARRLVAVALLVGDGCRARAVRHLRPALRRVARVLRVHRLRRRRHERGGGARAAEAPAARHLPRARASSPRSTCWSRS